MTRRSPFGELVYTYRSRLGLSQEALAKEIARLASSGTGGIEGTVSDKTIFLHELEHEHPATYTIPRAGTIKVYADAFRLPEDSVERRDFFAAAEESRALKKASREAGKETRPPAPALTDDFVLRGRELPWARLRDELDAVLDGRPRVALVRGEAGIGKTRLLRELARQAERSHGDLVVAWGHCVAAASAGPAASPYHPFREILALLIGDIQGAGAGQLVSPTTGSRLRDRAPRAFTAMMERGPYLFGPLLDIADARLQAESLGLVSDAWREQFDMLIATRPRESTEADMLHEQVAQALRQIAVDGPLVLVLDDLHWATAETVRLLSVLLHAVLEGAPVPILVLGSFRSHLLTQTNGLGPHPLPPVLRETQRLWGDIVIDLAGTTAPDQGRAYVDGRLDLIPNRLDRSFREELYQQTEGLPIFVENSLRALTDSGQLRPGSDGALVLTGRMRDIDMPTTSRAIIGRRLDDLDPAQRRALEIAAVQGEQFFAEPVAALLDLEPVAFADLFDMQLVDRQQLLVPGGTVAVAGQRLHRYQFAHALYQDYLGDSLGQIRREQHLGATARALEAVAGERPTHLAAIVADLYARAGLNPEAAAQHKVAGEYELDALNPDAAIRHFRRSIALADRQTQAEMVGHAMIGIGHGLRKMGAYEEAVLQCKTALSYGRALDSRQLTAYAAVFLGLLHYDLGENTVAEQEYRQALPILRELGQQREESRAEGLLAHALHGLGRYDEAIDAASRSLALAIRAGDDALAAESRLAAANCLNDLGLYEEAIALYEHAIELYRRGHDRRGEAICHADIGLCYLNMAKWARAMTALERARETTDRLGIVRLMPHVLLYLGLTHEGTGDLDAAGQDYAGSLMLRLTYRQYAFSMDALAGVLRVCLATGRPWRARRIAWGIARWLEEHGPEGIEEPFRVAESCVAALDAFGETEAARRLLGASVAVLHERAAKITSAEHRACYLHNVPANRALLARAASLDGLAKG